MLPFKSNKEAKHPLNSDRIYSHGVHINNYFTKMDHKNNMNACDFKS